MTSVQATLALLAPLALGSVAHVSVAAPNAAPKAASNATFGTTPVAQDTGGAVSGEASLAPQEAGIQDLMQRADEAFQREDWVTAAGLYDRATKLAPQNADAWFRLGYSWHAAGVLYRAIPAHRRATEFDSVRPVAFYNLGCAYALGARYDEAFEALEQAKLTGMDRVGASVDSDSDLEGLREDPRFPAWRTALAELVPGVPAVSAIDFLLGEWLVRTPDGRALGRRRFHMQAGGHLCVEEREEPDGTLVTSLIYYRPDRDAWKRIVVNEDGDVIEYLGKVENGALRLTGDWLRSDGQRLKGRTTFRATKDGRVRQVTELSPDGVNWSRAAESVWLPSAEPTPRPDPERGTKKPAPDRRWGR